MIKTLALVAALLSSTASAQFSQARLSDQRTEPVTRDLGNGMTASYSFATTTYSWDPAFTGFVNPSPSTQTYPHNFPQYNGTLTSIRFGIKLGHSRDRDVTHTGTGPAESVHYSWETYPNPGPSDQGNPGVSYFSMALDSVGDFKFSKRETEPVKTITSKSNATENYLYTFSHTTAWSSSNSDPAVLAKFEGTGTKRLYGTFEFKDNWTFTGSPTTSGTHEWADTRFYVEYTH